jgi:uncharacterized RDD family membrane protein YckC
MSYASSSLDVHVTGRRVVATLIDGALFGLVNSAVAAVLNIDESTSTDLSLASLSTGASAWLLVFVVLYYVLLEGFFGLTVGKLITGIRVVDARTGGRPGLLAAVARTALRLIDGIFGYLLALIVVVNSDRRRRLGDMAAKTSVVRR